MMVYGSPQHQMMLHALVKQLRQRAAEALSQPTLDRLRTLLIAAGQLEQAAHDELANQWPADEAAAVITPLHAATAEAAAAFYASWREGVAAWPLIHRALLACDEALCIASHSCDAPLIVRRPEGYAFYALFPESYIAAAQSWLRDHDQVIDRRAAVIGIRSIGTSLAAVVAAVITAAGWKVTCFTIRPCGHPFARTVSIAPDMAIDAGHALIVDEGPGLSGSSMAATAEALVRAGVPATRISFFPGHAGEPGSAASHGVRRWWQRAPRYVTAIDEARFADESFEQRLAACVLRTVGGATLARFEDLGGGRWRNLAYKDTMGWPAVCAVFEAPKYRLVMTGGDAFLFKFAGLDLAPQGATTACEAARARLTRFARQGWCAAPLAAADGFIVRRWIDGEPLAHTDGSGQLMARIARYINEAAGPRLSRDEADASFVRLREMLCWNTKEAFGEVAAERACRLADEAKAISAGDTSRAYGDGRLAPHEFLRLPNGAVIKTDCTSHDADHTLVGRQPLTWDIAGALVEWRLDNARSRAMLKRFYAAGGEPIASAALLFYKAAYAALRAAQMKLSADHCADAAERTRLLKAYADYLIAWRHSLGHTDDQTRAYPDEQRESAEAVHL
jgi:hypothetical protein